MEADCGDTPSSSSIWFSPGSSNVLSVNTCHWILEMKGMIYCSVSGHIGQRANIAVCPPLITPDLSVGFRILLHKW